MVQYRAMKFSVSRSSSRSKAKKNRVSFLGLRSFASKYIPSVPWSSSHFCFCVNSVSKVRPNKTSLNVSVETGTSFSKYKVIRGFRFLTVWSVVGFSTYNVS